MKWFIFTLKNINFYSRARRKEFIIFLIYNFVFGTLLFGLDYLLGINFFNPVYSLLMLIPNLSITVSRLHDLELSGWVLLLLLVPIINIIVFILLMSLAGTVGPNKYGEDPKTQLI